MRDDGRDDNDGGHEDDCAREDFGEIADIVHHVPHDDGIQQGDEEDLHHHPGNILQVVDWLFLMGIVQDDAADGENECATSDYDQRVRKKLRPCVVLDVVPRPLKWGEQVDES